MVAVTEIQLYAGMLSSLEYCCGPTKKVWTLINARHSLFAISRGSMFADFCSIRQAQAVLAYALNLFDEIPYQLKH